MSFHSATRCHDGDGYADRKNSTEESSGLLDSPHSPPDEADRKQLQWPLLLIVIVFVETLILAILVSGIVYFLSKSSSQFPPNAVFSPAQHVIRYENVVFSSSFKPYLTKYQGPPSPETDSAWRELYNYPISRIDRKDAAKLANRTVPIPGDPDHYVVSIDVFHQLHCLQMLRKRAWYAEGYDFDHDMMNIDHIDHCIDSIRQSLMCSADVTPLTWAWDEEDQKLEPVAAITHTCRDFDAVREWARKNIVRVFDTSVRVEPDV